MRAWDPGGSRRFREPGRLDPEALWAPGRAWPGRLPSAGGRVRDCQGKGGEGAATFLRPFPTHPGGLWPLAAAVSLPRDPGMAEGAGPRPDPQPSPGRPHHLRGLLFVPVILVGAAGFYGDGIWGQLAGWSPRWAWSTGTWDCLAQGQAALPGLPIPARSLAPQGGREWGSLLTSPLPQAWYGRVTERGDKPGRGPAVLRVLGCRPPSTQLSPPRTLGSVWQTFRAPLRTFFPPHFVMWVRVENAVLSTRVPHVVRAGQDLRGHSH